MRIVILLYMDTGQSGPERFGRWEGGLDCATQNQDGAGQGTRGSAPRPSVGNVGVRVLQETKLTRGTHIR